MTAIPIADLLPEAEQLLADGQNDAAIDLLRAPDAPTDPDRCVLLARAYFQRGDARGDVFSAHFFAVRAIGQGRRTPEMLAIRAISAYRKTHYTEAVQTFREFVGPDSPVTHRFLLGAALIETGELEEAEPWLKDARDGHPDPEAWQMAWARLEAVRTEAARKVQVTRKPFGLGGPQTRRPLNVPTPSPSHAVSLRKGQGTAPKDFHWLAENIPCQKACPAGTDIPGYLAAIYRGDYDEAYRINLLDNVFPAVLGRVCSRPCEDACRHGWEGLGEPVAICFSKRSAADFKTQDTMLLAPWFSATGKMVAVIGSGVAGLACARNLALMGHAVTVYEKHERPGGMMNQGIPEFRLPRDIIDKEIDQVRRQGVEIVCGTEIGRDIPLGRLMDDHDAVVMAAGTLRPNLLDIPGQDLGGIAHGLPFLLQANETGDYPIGRHVVVIGGGFTAMDCARTAARLGANVYRLEESGPEGAMKLSPEAVKVLYRRSEKEMLVTPGEVEELGHEHIPMEFMVSPVSYVGEEGRVTAMRFVRNELGEPDASGRRRPVPIEGSEFDIPADTVLLATGQFPGAEWIDEALTGDLVEPDGWLRSGKRAETALAKVFVAGDFATGASTLIEAIAHGKEAARKVDTFLMGEERLVDVAEITDVSATDRARDMDYTDRVPMPTLPLPRRTRTAEVETGFDPGGSGGETQRCYFCHYKFEIDPETCIFCDWCIKAKPRPECIVKVNQLVYADDGSITGYIKAKDSESTKLIWINQADCIRCHACVDACPVDAISIQKVSLRTVRKADHLADQAKGPDEETDPGVVGRVAGGG